MRGRGPRQADCLYLAIGSQLDKSASGQAKSQVKVIMLVEHKGYSRTFLPHRRLTAELLPRLYLVEYVDIRNLPSQRSAGHLLT